MWVRLPHTKNDSASRSDEIVNPKNRTISLCGGTYTGDVSNNFPSGLGAWVHPAGQV